MSELGTEQVQAHAGPQTQRLPVHRVCEEGSPFPGDFVSPVSPVPPLSLLNEGFIMSVPPRRKHWDKLGTVTGDGQRTQTCSVLQSFKKISTIAAVCTVASELQIAEDQSFLMGT